MSKDLINMDDETLLLSASSGNTYAFEMIVDRWERKVYSLASRFLSKREDAEDATQEIFLKVYMKSHTFNGDSSFKTWLYSVALNSINDHRRKNRKKQMLIDEEIIDIKKVNNSDYGNPHDPYETVHKNQFVNLLKTSMHKLPKKQRTVLILKEYNDLTFEEIADVLRCPVSTIKSRMYKGLENLKLFLDDAR
jgi:RNA polymerase sigma-70 factor (ECF subfamily)